MDWIPGWRVEDMPDLTGKVAIVTGPTINGIGYESCVELSKRGAHVVLAGRSKSKGEEALKALKERVPTAKAEFMVLDLSDLQSVKDFTVAFKKKSLPLHMLVNSAGIMVPPFTLTVNKLESQFATNHLGHFLLTKLLLPDLKKSAPSRIVTVSSVAAFAPEMMSSLSEYGMVNASVAAAAADFEHLADDAPYNPAGAYGRSKLANVLFTRALARRLKDDKVYANVCHPGGIRTNLQRHAEVTSKEAVGETAYRYLLMGFEAALMTPPQGAVTQLYLATSPEVEEKDIRGQYFKPQATLAKPPSFVGEEREERLWEISEKLVKDFL
eukprot:TRINITY_DN14195_c0_g1_i1.p1 TRINITY_DN14195_c0_g1~~TRINITY_DN14195_c0_g1_i1.p1  ORF type:complete len:380 (-),score=85.31 TRINITY_DN14195_c0_g1_i1:303-1280(-)